MTLFEMQGKRKDPSGRTIEWSRTKANPRIKRFVLSYLLIEDEMVGDVLPELLSKKGISWV
jgi:hypothetical protein